MTKPEAIAELAALEEKERIAWCACNAKLAERDEFNQVWQTQYGKLLAKWTPLFNRKDQLKAFIAIA